MKLTYLMVSVAYLALTVSASGQKVEVSFDPAVDFSRFRNYALLESKNPSKLKGCHQAILDTIQVSLAKRGLLPVYDGEIPDLLIVYNAGIKEEVSIKGYEYKYTNSSAFVPVIEQPETLIVDVIDAKHNRLVWRGVATNTLVQDYSKAEKKAETATRKMFARYPPKH
ncbi:MAG TPA: DUF4136 domain-containing protein [Anaerolineales bacterium]|nr:DUF4136 domain-containing protein [Anaerolineales bacterium]